MFKKEHFKNISGMKDIRSLSWRDFEWFCQFFLKRLGFLNVHVTPAEKDGGVDLTANKNGQKYLIQAKNWREDWLPVNTVRELGGVMSRWEKRQKESVKGIIITTAPSFKTAEKEAKDLGIVILNRGKIDEVMSKIFHKENIVYFKNKSFRKGKIFSRKTREKTI